MYENNQLVYMYKKIKQISDVRIFTGIDNDILFIKHNKILNSFKNGIILTFQEECWRLMTYKNSVLALDENNRIMYSSDDTLIFSEQISHIVNEYIYYYIKTKPERTYGISRGNIKIFETKTISDIYLIDNYIIKVYENQLHKCDLDNTFFWQFPLSSLGNKSFAENEADEVDSILGVAYGNLWVSTKGCRLIALNIENGHLVYRNEGFGLTLDKKTNNIFSVSSNIITIINTQSLLIEESYNYKDADPNGIGRYERVYSPLLQGDYFTFIAEKKNDYGGCRHIGIFDYNARKLVWDYEVFTQEELNETKNKLVPPNPVCISGNNLYIKDFKDNLHIFEKTRIPLQSLQKR